ncbi:DUF3955 domain-containing protein [Vagococcus fluvialis]|uniref:DUF3955 domain-containing protein n=1 Tax=Vagococcus fluvialis TaxID=2738 RepID=UPI00288E86ED|nr:DUF3955 domain-containing protein [Vagococcus fluvialis]MDT2747627.1 DUF3955 domain-containing protein [Vagococcus fluvialis]
MTQTNKAPLLTKISLVFFILGLLSLITKNFMPEWVDASGMLHEPYFLKLAICYNDER